MNGNNAPVENPTWYGNIRGMFTDTDITHMKNQGLDLTSYDDVKNNAGGIYGQVAARNMPPGAPWNPDQVNTFLNWMSNNYPKGTPPPQAATLFKATMGIAASRVRKEISSLSEPELQTLIKAFEGIRAKDITDPNSYFIQAGYHWLPAGNLFCQHHVAAYNPWHRAYLMSFENALRSVPGCEDVTLPYWDITQPLPEVLQSAPFDSYTLPKDVGPAPYVQGYVTQRNSYDEIKQNLSDNGVADDISYALEQTDWEDFHGMLAGAPNRAIIAAHDGGHVAIGPTMAHPDVAAFDPVFWFFHCNWDRLFWNWQVQMQATTLTGLLTTINQHDSLSNSIFTNDVLKGLMVKPFNGAPLNFTTVSIIDSVNSLGVDYQNPAHMMELAMTPKMKRASFASDKFSVNTNMVNVRVQGLNRLKIPGSFKVRLLKDGEVIATKGFFQPNEVEKCENCVNNAVVHFDFQLPLERIQDGKLEVAVEPLDKSFVGDRFPNKLMGNPTVDVRFLVSNE
jgi:hypothetical protein